MALDSLAKILNEIDESEKNLDNLFVAFCKRYVDECNICIDLMIKEILKTKRELENLPNSSDKEFYFALCNNILNEANKRGEAFESVYQLINNSIVTYNMLFSFKSRLSMIYDRIVNYHNLCDNLSKKYKDMF